MGGGTIEFNPPQSKVSQKASRVVAASFEYTLAIIITISQLNYSEHRELIQNIPEKFYPNFFIRGKLRIIGQ